MTEVYSVPSAISAEFREHDERESINVVVGSHVLQHLENLNRLLIPLFNRPSTMGEALRHNGTIDGDFYYSGLSWKSIHKYHMVHNNYEVYRYGWAVKTGVEYLIASAKADFTGPNKLTGITLVQKYGTHFIGGGYVG